MKSPGCASVVEARGPRLGQLAQIRRSSQFSEAYAPTSLGLATAARAEAWTRVDLPVSVATDRITPCEHPDTRWSFMRLLRPHPE